MAFWKISEFSKKNITVFLKKLKALEIMRLQMRILTSSLSSDLFCLCQDSSSQPMIVLTLIDPEQLDIQPIPTSSSNLACEEGILPLDDQV